MRLLDVAYMEKRFGGKLPKLGNPQAAAGVYTGGGGFGAVDTVRVGAAISEAEAWFYRQIPVFREAEPALLPLDLKAAIADIGFDSMFDLQSKDKKNDVSKAELARALILRLAPSYENASLDTDTGEIILDEQASLVGIEMDWSS